MKTVQFIVDDFELARRFVKNLPSPIRTQRFGTDFITGKSAPWTPDHLVLAVANGTAVAMADCIIGDDQKVANGSLVSLDGFGAYCVQAFLRLKQVCRVGHWESTLVNPTRSTVAISRKYFDSTYDQITWDIFHELAKVHGRNARIILPILMASRSLLKYFGLSNQLDESSKQQLFAAAKNLNAVKLVAPNGKSMDSSSVMALTFDALDISFNDRQNLTRMLLIMNATVLGHKIPTEFQRAITNTNSMDSFLTKLKASSKAVNMSQGSFKAVAS